MSKKAKKAAAPKAAGEAKGDVTTLRQLCSQYKIDPVAARVRLRAAVKAGTVRHEAGASWEWARDAAALSDVRKILDE